MNAMMIQLKNDPTVYQFYMMNQIHKIEFEMITFDGKKKKSLGLVITFNDGSTATFDAINWTIIYKFDGKKKKSLGLVITFNDGSTATFGAINWTIIYK